MARAGAAHGRCSPGARAARGAPVPGGTAGRPGPDLVRQVFGPLGITLADPDLYTRDPKKFATLMDHIAKLRLDKEAAELRWLEVAEMAEELER